MASINPGGKKHACYYYDGTWGKGGGTTVGEAEKLECVVVEVVSQTKRVNTI